MGTPVWVVCVLLLVSVEETLTQDQPAVKNPVDNKDVAVVLVLSTLGVIALISLMTILLIFFCKRSHRRERNTHDSNEGIDTAISLMPANGTSVDTVSINITS